MRHFAFVFAVVFAAPLSALALNSHCIALAQNQGVTRASLNGNATLADDELRLHFVGHSTYVIETADGTTAATDFTGFVGPDLIPDLVTMNNAHSSHFTDTPDTRIDHVLKGWGGSEPAYHRLELGEMLVRNVTTDLRGEFGSIKDGNSIFIFEVAGLCIGHLGHLHYEPNDEQYALIGRLDVVMVPVDGGRTLDTNSMIRVMKRVHAQLVLPMHWFGNATLESFLVGMSDEFEIDVRVESSTTTSLRDLPRKPTVRVLLPAIIDGTAE